MKINGKTYTLAKTTLADIKALAPMKYVEGWAPDDGEDLIECETDEAIDVEGMRFKVIFWFDVEDPEDPYDAARLAFLPAWTRMMRPGWQECGSTRNTEMRIFSRASSNGKTRSSRGMPAYWRTRRTSCRSTAWRSPIRTSARIRGG